MVVPLYVCGKEDDALLAKLAESLARYQGDPTQKNYAAYRQAFHAFANWVMRAETGRRSRVVGSKSGARRR
jgi:hypothetical protein